jgi:hypothetical protein
VNRKNADDKVVIDPVLLEEAVAPRARAIATRAEEPRAFARGTRDRVHCPNSLPPVPRRSAGPPELERDPVAVLRAWPHSTVRNDPPVARAAPPSPPPSLSPSRAQRRVRDKITLAHFALDLFSELDELQAIVQRVDDASDDEADHAGCTDPRCTAKLNVMRGALLEACLLVQRVAMTPPNEPVDIEDRIHELLELLQQ